jgi:tagaturonate reductase
MSRRIVQFGTSRFLQAHVDLFVHEARAGGQEIGPITVVKTTAGDDRSGRVQAFSRPEGFPVRIRGYRDGVLVDETVQVRSVDRAFSAHEQWPRVVDDFVNDAKIVVSNVGDRGYDVAEVDRCFDFQSKGAPPGFPSKLLALLLARYSGGGRPLLFLPSELRPSNGQTLAAIVANLAVVTRTTAAFRDWLKHEVMFADTLVDRIVSDQIEPIGAIAEPYALWAIRRADFGELFAHPAVMMVDDLEPFERLKLHILNLGHTVLAEEWLRRGHSVDETVQKILAEPLVFRRLSGIYAEEVIPGFALRDMGAVATRYVQTTMERLQNPFLNHRISDIAKNHAIKVGIRVRAFVDWVNEKDQRFCMPQLTKIAGTYR